MNIVILTGRLVKDPELQYTSGNNTAVCKFTIAVDRAFSKEKEADFISIVAWSKTAEFVNKYFSKGRKINLSGRMQVRNYEKDSKKVYITEVIADNVEFGDSKPANTESTEFSL